MIRRILSILIIVLVAGLVWWLVRKARERRRQQRSDRARPDIEPMVACAHCGVHIPRHEASWNGDVPYCSDAHRRAGPRPPGQHGL
ncbi:MAG: PP0621 family protein [Pseudomonadota bacterium]